MAPIFLFPLIFLSVKENETDRESSVIGFDLERYTRPGPDWSLRNSTKHKAKTNEEGGESDRSGMRKRIQRVRKVRSFPHLPLAVCMCARASLMTQLVLSDPEGFFGTVPRTVTTYSFKRVLHTNSPPSFFALSVSVALSFTPCRAVSFSSRFFFLSLYIYIYMYVPFETTGIHEFSGFSDTETLFHREERTISVYTFSSRCARVTVCVCVYTMQYRFQWIGAIRESPLCRRLISRGLYDPRPSDGPTRIFPPNVSTSGRTRVLKVALPSALILGLARPTEFHQWPPFSFLVFSRPSPRPETDWLAAFPSGGAQNGRNNKITRLHLRDPLGPTGLDCFLSLSARDLENVFLDTRRFWNSPLRIASGKSQRSTQNSFVAIRLRFRSEPN